MLVPSSVWVFLVDQGLIDQVQVSVLFHFGCWIVTAINCFCVTQQFGPFGEQRKQLHRDVFCCGKLRDFDMTRAGIEADENIRREATA